MLKFAGEVIPSSVSQKLVCSICGQPINIHDYDLHLRLPQKMLGERLCYRCAFWKDKAEHPDPNREIINGQHYIFKPMVKEKHYFQGMGGRFVYILKTDGTVKMSNDVWFQGEIPKHFLPLFPDTAKIISRQMYFKIKKCQKWFKCNRIGCYDRYHCYWYHQEIMEPDGKAWNKVPKNWVVGGELCPSFLNKEMCI